ncbi:MAG TPA: recombinase family protein [Terrimicrobiaceae bacterium]
MTSELRTESLGRWAKRCGVTYRTAWRWFRDNRLPDDVIAEQMPTGTILIRDRRILRNTAHTEEAVIYARINPRQDQALMHEQIESCRTFCRGRGWTITKVIREVAPGVGLQRVKLTRLIEQRTPRLVVATPSVLSRFDFRLYEALWPTMQSELVVVDRSEELGNRGGALEDLTDAINIICHRHYGPKRGTALVEILSRVVRGTLAV